MSAVNVLPKVVVALGFAIAIGFGLTTYTSPILGAAESGELAGLIHRALGDSAADLPGPPPSIGVVPVTPESIPPSAEFHRERQAPTATQPSEWLAAAARADSAALRAWLGRLVVLSSRPRGDTVFGTYRRLGARRGCPLVSHLRTATVLSTRQLVRVTGDCPRVE